MAAELLGNLALTKELRSRIAALPGVVEGLLILQPIQIARSKVYSHCNLAHSPYSHNSIAIDRSSLHRLWDLDHTFCLFSTRALTILNTIEAQVSESIDHPPPFSHLLEVYPGGLWSPKSGIPHVWFYWSRIQALREMEMYRKALPDIDLATHNIQQVAAENEGVSKPFAMADLHLKQVDHTTLCSSTSRVPL